MNITINGTTYKSVDYLAELREMTNTTEADLLNILEIIGYIMTDNGNDKARWLLDDLAELVENGDIITSYLS